MQTDDSPRKILVIQTAYLGDTILTTPLLMGIRARFPKAHISVLLVPRTRDVLEGHPAVDEILVYDKQRSFTGWLGVVRMARALRSRGFDVCFLPHRSFRSGLMAKVAGIPRRVGFEKSPGQFFYTDRLSHIAGKHEADRCLDLLLPFMSRSAAPVSPSIPVLPRAEERVARVFRETGMDQSQLLVAMAPGSAWETKRWIPEGFGKVADVLFERHGATVLILGSKEEKPIADAILRAAQSRPVDLTGQSLMELAATLSRCRLLITNDNGAMHLASALSLPIVVIYGSTSPESGLGPYSREAQIVEKSLPCRPCGLHGHHRCPQVHFRCMLDITPEEVVAAVEKQLMLIVNR